MERIREGARGQGGQATIEWVGLVLAVGLALGALALGARGAVSDGGREPAGRRLGQALAERITCAARDFPARGGCPAGLGSAAAGGPAPVGRPVLPGVPGAPPADRRALPRLPRLPNRRPRGGVGARLDRLAGRAGSLAEGAWLACLGYGAMRYDIAHPRTPREMRPIGATLDIVGDCVNPWALLFG
jgi:hypothetical protein